MNFSSFAVSLLVAVAAVDAVDFRSSSTSTSGTTGTSTHLRTPGAHDRHDRSLSSSTAACLANSSCQTMFCSKYGDFQCENADCVQLNNPPYYVCDCDYGYIPTADPDVCIAGQAYDVDGDADLCKDNAYCDPESTCDNSMGYVECICENEMEYDPMYEKQMPKVVQQGVQCSTGRGEDSSPCDPNYCDPRATCSPSARDNTLAECQCPYVQGFMEDELVLLPGFACPYGVDPSYDDTGSGSGSGSATSSTNTEDMYSNEQDSCSPNHCDEAAMCQSSPDLGGGAECHCPGGQILRPYYECPEVLGSSSSNSMYTSCAQDPCHFSTPCIQHSPDAPPKCQCPNGFLVDAGNDCPTDHLQHSTTEEGSCEAETCPEGSACQASTSSSSGGGVMCLCGPSTGYMHGDLVLPGRGVCQNLCLEPHGMTYDEDDRVNPCSPEASCQMVQGWAQCSCPHGPVLHHEDC
jgi:hypothetical protein